MRKGIMKKLGMLVIASVLVIGSVGCSSKDKDKQESALDKDTLVVGYDNTFVPMGFLDKDNKATGFDVDLAREVFKRLGKDVKFENIDWGTKQASLDRKTVDMLWNGYSLNEERKKKVTYTDPYMDNRTIIVTMADSPIKTKEDLKGKEAGTQEGSTSYEAIEKNKEFKDSLKDKEPVLYDTFDKALRDLEIGRTQAVVGDEVLIKYYIKQKGADKYRVLDGDLGAEQYVVGMRKGDTKLRDAINKEFKEIKEDGTYQKIYDKWFK